MKLPSAYLASLLLALVVPAQAPASWRQPTDGVIEFVGPPAPEPRIVFECTPLDLCRAAPDVLLGLPVCIKGTAEVRDAGLGRYCVRFWNEAGTKTLVLTTDAKSDLPLKDGTQDVSMEGLVCERSGGTVYVIEARVLTPKQKPNLRFISLSEGLKARAKEGATYRAGGVVQGEEDDPKELKENKGRGPEKDPKENRSGASEPDKSDGPTKEPKENKGAGSESEPDKLLRLTIPSSVGSNAAKVSGRSTSSSAGKTVWVRPYIRKDGTRVEGHFRSPPKSKRR